MGALTGLKILDFSALLPGPFATMYLADMGAEVLRVESPSRPNLDTYAPPLVQAEGASKGISANNAYLARNKKSLFLDTKHPEAVEIVQKLVKEYDIVIEQFRPGVMERLGIGYEQLKRHNPNLIYVSLTGYGQTGPASLAAGHDINYLARSGLMSYSGRKEGGPSIHGLQIADVCAGSLHTVIAVLAAVIYRNQTGKGQYVDVGMLDGTVGMLGPTGAAFLLNMDQGTQAEPTYESALLNGGSMYDYYETADKRYLSVGPVEPKFFAHFCACIGHPELSAGGIMQRDPQVKETVRTAIKEKTLAQWIKIFEGKDACTEPVKTLKEALLEDDQIKARELVVKVPILEGNGAAITQVAMPIKLSECPGEYRHSGCRPGYHTDEILAQLGYGSETIEQLRIKGVCAPAPKQK